MTENDEMSEIINKNNTETSNDSKSKNVGNDSDESNETSDIKPLVVEKQVAGYIDHLAISQSLGYQIFRKDRRNTWTPEEDKCLKELLIAQYLKINQLEKYNNEPINVKHIDWIEIANHMSTKRKGKECKKRWSSSLDPFLRKGKWTQAEDDALIQAFKKYGSLWQKVASEIEGRNEDQCSKRYTEVLNSDTKERLKPWTLDEDLTLIDKVKQFGTKWRQISAYLPSRPSLTCRNRWRKIMTDIAKDTASDVIKKAIGVLDKNGKPIVKFQKTEDLTRERKDKKKAQNSSSNFKGIRKRSNSPLSENQSEIEERTSSNTEEHNDSTRHRFTGPPNKKIKKSTHTQESTGNENKQHNHKTGHKHNKDNDKTSTSYQRIASPPRTQTDWSFSLIDPRTNEEMKSYSANINTHELAHYLIELARFNGVTLAVHQHIHHHYSSGTPNANVDPQSNISRYGHFNYLPPLMEVPKLTSSSSPDNTVDSQTSNKNFPENSLLRLLNNEEEHTSKKSKHKSSKNSGDVNDTGKSFSKSHRQQLYPSNSTPNSNISTPLTPSFQENGNTDKSNYSSNSASSNNNNNSSSSNNNNNNNNNANNKNNNDRKSYITEDINEELDFWETMRSMNHPKNSKPVSQHHPLHYNQPSNYKEQLPYQPSDSFGIQRFPNMATPLATNMIDADSKGTPSVQTNITSINTDGGYGGMYMNGQNPDPDEEEEEEMDIANQYGMYYSIFANKGQSVYGSYGKQNGGNGVNNGGATGLINSGYLMPFNPS